MAEQQQRLLRLVAKQDQQIALLLEQNDERTKLLRQSTENTRQAIDAFRDYKGTTDRFVRKVLEALREPDPDLERVRRWLDSWLEGLCPCCYDQREERPHG